MFILASVNAQLKVVHISSECNRIPDILSRWMRSEDQVSRFRAMTAGIKVVEVVIDDKCFEFEHKW